MRSSSSSSGFDIREAVESLRDAFTPRSDSARTAHGDIRAAILAALAREPKNGQQVIQAISSSSGGAWMPSAGIVYPALQLLTDSGLISTGYNGERIVYTLTDAGREAAAVMATASSASTSPNSGTSSMGGSGMGASGMGASSTGSSRSGSSSSSRGDWRMPRMGEGWHERTAAVPKAGAKLAQAAAQVTQSGTREQQERAAAILDETRKRLYAILAED